MEVRAPPHLKVGDVLCSFGSHQLLRCAIERLGILQQGDRQVERAQQVGLISTTLGGDERGAHPSPILRRINAPRGGQFQRQRRIE